MLTVLSRTADESVTEDELGLLQQELETMLVSVTRRRQLLVGESEALALWQDNKTKPNEIRAIENKNSRGKVVRKFLLTFAIYIS